MPRSIQETAQSENVVVETKTTGKRITKKRGRSYNRQEKRSLSKESRLIRDELILNFASREFRREMNQFEKTVKEGASKGIFDIPMPPHLADLRSNFMIAEGNLKAAQIAIEAMQKFPPL